MIWRRKWQPTPVFFPGKSHGWKSLVDYSPWGYKEWDKTEQLHSKKKVAHWFFTLIFVPIIIPTLSFLEFFISAMAYVSTAYPLFKQSQSSNYLPNCKDWLIFPSLSYRLVLRVYHNSLLTSGKVEMLLFSKFNSSSALHFANDLGIADSLLYLRPRRLKLDRFPVNIKKKGIFFLKNLVSLSLFQAIKQYLWITFKYYFSKILNFLYQETTHYTLQIRMKLKPLLCPPS